MYMYMHILHAHITCTCTYTYIYIYMYIHDAVFYSRNHDFRMQTNKDMKTDIWRLANMDTDKDAASHEDRDRDGHR